MNIDVLAIIAAVLAAIVTYLATPLVMRLATHLEIIDGTEDELLHNYVNLLFYIHFSF